MRVDAKVMVIDSKENHPNADNLTVYHIGDLTCIEDKILNENYELVDRYEVGDLVVFIPEKSIVPDWILKKLELWDNFKNKGLIGSRIGNRVKRKKIRNIYSDGLLYPCESFKEHTSQCSNMIEMYGDEKFVFGKTNDSGYTSRLKVKEGDVVTDLLEIRTYNK